MTMTQYEKLTRDRHKVVMKFYQENGKLTRADIKNVVGLGSNDIDRVIRRMRGFGLEIPDFMTKAESVARERSAKVEDTILQKF